MLAKQLCIPIVGALRLIGLTNLVNRHAPAPARNVPQPTAADSVFESILTEIVRGTYPPGTRLPPERELSQKLGASRPTLREAMRKMTAWQVVEPRRGSGVTVRDRREWSIEVLPAYMRYADNAPVIELLEDMLAVRRSLLRSVLSRASRRVGRAGLDIARGNLARAWDARDSGVEFVQLDLSFMRSVVEAAQLLPAMWLLNRLSTVYVDLAGLVAHAIAPPDDYFDAFTDILNAIEAGDRKKVERRFDSYIQAHDDRVLAIVGRR